FLFRSCPQQQLGPTGFMDGILFSINSPWVSAPEATLYKDASNYFAHEPIGKQTEACSAFKWSGRNYSWLF
ncbi:MAG: hypothetical protein ACI9O8_001606, partial [Patiriisocius sp.]